MTLEITKHFMSKDLCYFKMLKIMNAVKISKFFFFFTLRQGTLLIAIIELWLTSFALFLLFLSFTHAEFLMDLVSQELLQLEKNNMTSANFVESYYFRNEQKMLLGQHLASVMLIMIYTGIVLLTIHFISCLLLLYGTLRNKANYLLPWATTDFLGLVSSFFTLFLLLYLPSDRCKFGFVMANLSLICLELYAWLTVFSYYRELKP